MHFFPSQDGNITSITNGSLPRGLSEIHIFGHPLTNLSDDAFDNSATMLQNLEIIDAQFMEIPRAILNLPLLLDLHIADTPLQHWNDSTLDHLAKNITYLTFSNVGLLAWPRSISNFHLLLSLDLSGNLLKTIPDDAFSSLIGPLIELSLENTGLTHVPTALSVPTILRSLNISGNKFVDETELEKLSLFPVGTYLSHLYLLSVGLTRILNFSNMTKLIEINLSNNNISDSTAGSFPPSLAKLSLANNQLSSVPTSLSSLTGLGYLDLSFNQISEIPVGSLPSTIAALDLSNNKFNIITNTTFTNLSYLFNLWLVHNPISTISPWAFADVPMLMFLYLDYTDLTEIPLALAKLSAYGNFMIGLDNIPSLACPSPIPMELNAWYNTLNSIVIYGNCKNGQSIADYFSTNHYTLPTTTPTTTPSSDASGLEYIFVCRYSSLTLIVLYSLMVIE